ncbi:DUF7594 domain-containing protein [Kineococcus radiotolerans]|uniref:Fibronectin type III domain protein n=1 Tax=Kineococcus radiotolerans (strain ATCC BAA-149 / DSM 14245 / SRS30216) TaxID=266940 RepID=A6W922_KINRD|nr:LamG-like jellyroll fold domain-containing protein [Kineococcus radiotolerans]ABS03311.1 Fibronectin type III domain protein [Kineococcus radiotolerans SRS30216 = ATCC BAA-149]
MTRPLLALATALSTLLATAVATTAPAAAIEAPVAFAAVALPTWQADGVAWATTTAGGTVFVGGTFTAIRPPGAPAGTGQVPRTNLAAFDAATGEPTGCAPAFTLKEGTATVRALAVSPDGATLYVGGSFDTVDGVARQHLAALDLATCRLRTDFTPLPQGPVRALAVDARTVWLGGSFTAVGTTARSKAAAVAAVGTPDQGRLTAWDPSLDDDVLALALRPGGGQVVIGGSFDTVGGTVSHGLTVVDAASGTAVRRFTAAFVPAASQVKAIAVDATGFYVANEGYGTGSFDGRFAVDWDTWTQRWRDGCLGATQDVEVFRGVLYSASHAHDCRPINAYPDEKRWHFLAETTQTPDKPSLLPWFPDTDDGIGERIGPRAITIATTASRGPVLWGVGEFTTVNGAAQQSITRFGSGPEQAGPSAMPFVLTSDTAGQVRVAWRRALDLDDSNLTYRVYREGTAAPIATLGAASWHWHRPQSTVVDSGLTVGSTLRYRVEVSDGATTRTTDWRAVTVRGTSSAYADQVRADGAVFLWRYDEPGDVLVSDSVANHSGTLSGGGTFRVTPAAIGDDPSTARTLSGGGGTIHSEVRYNAPKAFTVETWFRTTTMSGGKIIGFGDRRTLNSSSNDKHIYMTNSGRLVFGVLADGRKTLSTPGSYNDGRWHHVAATQGASGMALYVDGMKIASNAVTTNQNVPGYWRVGGDTIASGWPDAPSSTSFVGTVDETAYYAKALPPAAIARHVEVARTPPPDTTAPTAPGTSVAAVQADRVQLTWAASTDASGVTGYVVHRSATPGFTPSTATAVARPTTATAIDDPGTGTWYYRVTAVDAAGNTSPASAQVQVQVERGATTVNLSPTADTFANAGAPGTNFGTSAQMTSRGSTGAIAYLRFDLPAAPAGTSLLSATLRLRTSSDSLAGSVEPAPIRLATGDWGETTLTWRDKPALGSAVLGTVPAGSTPEQPFAVPLTAAALSPGTTVTLAIAGEGTDSLSVWTREQTRLIARPVLDLQYG